MDRSTDFDGVRDAIRRLFPQAQFAQLTVCNLDGSPDHIETIIEGPGGPPPALEE